ncbi:N-acetylglucosamine-6-phosphate deacetylase [Homoserinibacter sp. YIM 151385]|uniref:N-acetylglucosamine-6-phosphate deacetylase n=1 Tax=Homoserinibacter sp. YIM 151385 TaxID=2985506 RepID=UPI0022F0BEF8|nr:N-acetylglucosamine-6-phosphate deacetylase [Homoserinibacter sp. YIM 151385]WBU36765.1 N-acetylglucosamine-6-phosphate deacetylase [Homoserinibacter sp. YIM 151385]
MTTLLHSARRIDARGVLEDAWVLLDGDAIAATGTGSGPDAVPRPEADELVDARDRILVPGFIDLHGHGGGGARYDAGGEELERALAAHRRHGTTRQVVSLVANPLPALHDSLAGIAALAARDPLVLGAHLEGPYLSPGKPGAHEPAFLRRPSGAEIDELLDAAQGTLRQITIAPELPGGLDAIAQLAAAGVAVAIGHTDADADMTRTAFDAGATLLTHAFNAMNGIHHRAPGPVAAAIADERVTIELILDGQHVHPDVARIVLDAAPGRVALVTDAMAAAGAEDGDYTLGSLHVTVREGLALLSGTTTIAGSTLTQDAALRLAVGRLRLDPVDAVAALTAVPAAALGLGDRLGLIEEGYAADAVLLDADWRVEASWGAGARLV